MNLRLWFILLLPILCVAQERSLPQPKLGWDSFESALQYPELGLRAGIRTAYMVSVEIDSTGVLQSVLVRPYIEGMTIGNVKYSCPLNPADSLFIQAINAACHSIVWTAGSVEGRPATMRAEFPIIFNFYSSETPSDSWRMIIKNAVRRIQTDPID